MGTFLQNIFLIFFVFYCMSKKSCPILYKGFQYQNGQEFLGNVKKYLETVESKYSLIRANDSKEITLNYIPKKSSLENGFFFRCT